MITVKSNSFVEVTSAISGLVSINDTDGGLEYSTTINHNLGFVPHCEVYLYFADDGWKKRLPHFQYYLPGFDATLATTSSYYVTATDLVIYLSSPLGGGFSGDWPFFYIIYPQQLF